jgi:hypothetical protein
MFHRWITQELPGVSIRQTGGMVDAFVADIQLRDARADRVDKPGVVANARHGQRRRVRRRVRRSSASDFIGLVLNHLRPANPKKLLSIQTMPVRQRPEPRHQRITSQIAMHNLNLLLLAKSPPVRQ